ncbi:MAG: SDR family oxidoreductase [Candidatus Dormibacteria bacterium]
MELADRSALVTGAASGIGREVALQLLHGQARVLAVDIDLKGLEALREDAGAYADRLVLAVADVADEAAVNEVVSTATVDRPLTVLVNSAGVVQDGLLVRRDGDSVLSLPTAQWRRVVAINLEGPFLVARQFARRLLECAGGPGVIVNISSVAAPGNGGQSNYAAAKAGLESSTRTWAQDLAPYGVRVGCVSPGLIDTPMLGQISNVALNQLRRRVWLDRIGKPFEIWQAVRFVIECDYFTGRCVQVDGGLSV